MTLWKTLGTLLFVVATPWGSFAGCTKENAPAKYPAPGASQDDELPPEQSGELTDSQLVGVVASIDLGELRQARIARTRGNDPRVRQFARSMIEQHTDSTQKASALASRYGLTAATSSHATTLRDKARDVSYTLERTPLRSFDLAYIQGQIEQHQAVLTLLRDSLIPAADNQALAMQLLAASNMIEAHLNTAQELLPLLKTDEQLPPGASELPPSGVLPE